MRASRLTATSRRRFTSASAGRDEAADDDVLLEPVESVGLAVDRRLGEHARRLLERSRRDERARLQRSLSDAEQHRVALGGLLGLGLGAGVDLVEFDLVDLLALDQLGLAAVERPWDTTRYRSTSPLALDNRCGSMSISKCRNACAAFLDSN
jgi:hypothetical protein